MILIATYSYAAPTLHDSWVDSEKKCNFYVQIKRYRRRLCVYDVFFVNIRQSFFSKNKDPGTTTCKASDFYVSIILLLLITTSIRSILTATLGWKMTFKWRNFRYFRHAQLWCRWFFLRCFLKANERLFIISTFERFYLPLPIQPLPFTYHSQRRMKSSEQNKQNRKEGRRVCDSTGDT